MRSVYLAGPPYADEYRRGAGNLLREIGLGWLTHPGRLPDSNRRAARCRSWKADLADINFCWRGECRDRLAVPVGDQIKIRLVNEMESDHPMHHPFHIHGAGRFLVLTRDGIVEPNLVWKDTVLVRTGETVDILLDVEQSRPLDGALPHRGAPRERDDV